MSTEPIDQIKKKVESMFGVNLKKLPRKKIIYDGVAKDNKLLVLISPSCEKLCPGGYGWVDITKIQRDLASKYSWRIIAFRLPDSKTYYYDFHELSGHLSEEAMMNNSHEGDHWKLDIWPRHIKIRKSNTILSIGSDALQELKLGDNSSMYIRNRIHEFEKEICSILAQLAYHIHPKIVERIQSRNIKEFDYFKELFANKIEVGNYLFDGSACVFPGVRRYVSRQGKLFAYNIEYKAIIDDNRFPRSIWCFLANSRTYSGPNWKETGLSEFELAHVFTHKESEIEFEKQFFSTVQNNLYPYSDFSCACNVVLLPKGAVKPTDNLKAIKAAFYKRYIDLYGESPLNGRSGFNESLVPNWYNDLNWNKPYLPIRWESNIDKLLKYRTKRITGLLNK